MHHETLGDAKRSQCIENCANFHFQHRNEKTTVGKTLKCEMWFMGHIMAVSGLLAKKGVQPVSDHSGGEKKALGWLRLSVVPSFSLSLTFPLCLPSSFSFWPSMFCPSPSTVPPPFTSVYSSLLSLLSLFQCLLSAFPSCSLQYFTELCASVAQIVGKKGGAFASAVAVIFPLFLLCVGGLIPFSHCISTCWGNRAELLHLIFFFPPQNEVFVTGM